MKYLLSAPSCLVLMFVAAPLFGQVSDADGIPSAAACDSPERVEWLLGAWETTGGRTVFRETWVRLGENTWEGSGQVLDAASGEVRSEEALRLLGMVGSLFYLAKVEHNKLPISFAATECSDEHVVFENPDHDFPKRIAYRRVDADHVTVDVDDGAGEGFTLEFARMKK